MTKTRWIQGRARSLAAALVLTTLVSPACGDRNAGTAAKKTATPDTAAPAAPAAPARLTVIDSLPQPEAARYDPELDVWFVSSVNGDPVGKDNNGFISRLTADGAVDSLRFIAGGQRGVKLHAPKGLVIVGDTLWVADIDAIRAFNKRTGAPIVSVDLAGKAKFLNDGTVGPDGLYFTDSGMDGKGHSGPDRIFHLVGHRATVALESDSLLGPNGITWDSAGGRFIIVPFLGRTVFAWKPGETVPTPIGAGPEGQDGVEVLANGDIIFTSWSDSSLSVLRGGQVTRLVGNLPSPADIGVDRRRGRIAVPLLMEGRVEFWTIPVSESAGATVAGQTHGEWVYIKTGADSVHAYVAYPQRKTKAPGVIVIHEIFGLTKWEQGIVDSLAMEGFVALAPDLLSSKFGTTPADADSARKLVSGLDPRRVTAELDAAYAYLNGLPAVDRDKIGTIGFCWGGGQSFRYATTNPNLKAAVVCYGPAPDTAAMKRIRASVLGVYGENDARITAALPEVAAAMNADGKNFVYEVYPETGHGFLKPGRQGFDGPQPARAWARVHEFLRARLGS